MRPGLTRAHHETIGSEEFIDRSDVFWPRGAGNPNTDKDTNCVCKPGFGKCDTKTPFLYIYLHLLSFLRARLSNLDW